MLVGTRFGQTLCLTYARRVDVANTIPKIQVHTERHVTRRAVARTIVEKVTYVLHNQIDGDCNAKDVGIKDPFSKFYG